MRRTPVRPPRGLAGPDAAEPGWNGVCRPDPDGAAHLLADGQTRPDGIGLSPDERTLCAASPDGAARRRTACPVNDGPGPGAGAVLPDLTGSGDAGAPDGFAVDSAGDPWAGGPGGIVVVSPEGDHPGTVRLPEQPASAAFGNGGRTLCATARTGLCRIDTLVEGLTP